MASSTLAIVRTHSHGHGSDVPWQFVVAYIAVGLICWFATTVLLLRHEQAKTGKPADGDDKVMALIAGATAAVAWPLAVVGVCVWKAVERFMRPSTGPASSDR